MMTIILTMIAGSALILGVVLTWLFVHLLAQRRLGERPIGCHGGEADSNGEITCCHAIDSCDPEMRRNCRFGQLGEGAGDRAK